MAANSICLSPNGQYLRREALSGAAGILPGHLLIEDDSGEVVVNATADDVVLRKLFADINIGDAGDIARVYTDGENVHYVSAVSGDFVTARFAGGITLALNAQVASAGDGTLKAPAAPGVGVLGVVKEVVTAGVGAESGAGFAVIELV